MNAATALCVDCHRPMVSYRRWARGERPLGHVPYRANGRCPMCDQQIRRAASTPPRRAVTPPTAGFLERDTSWQVSALCAQVDPEVFFPEIGCSDIPAKRVCAQCPVRDECLDDALATGAEGGIRGGLSERERKRLARTRAA